MSAMLRYDTGVPCAPVRDLRRDELRFDRHGSDGEILRPYGAKRMAAGGLCASMSHSRIRTVKYPSVISPRYQSIPQPTCARGPIDKLQDDSRGTKVEWPMNLQRTCRKEKRLWKFCDPWFCNSKGQNEPYFAGRSGAGDESHTGDEPQAVGRLDR
jgi:hypothetical protein